MSNTQLLGIGLILGAAAIGLWYVVLLPQQNAKAALQARLNLEGGEDLQPTNQRIDDPLGKNLGVRENG